MNSQIIEAFGFTDKLDAANKGLCPICKQPVVKSDFRDQPSLAEYRISKLCQHCIDRIFGDL